MVFFSKINDVLAIFCIPSVAYKMQQLPLIKNKRSRDYYWNVYLPTLDVRRGGFFAPGGD